ncbi:MAG TPA: hypothetical protein VFF27_18360, partial [Bacteroidia bacterium]|nr:hypothetical protein [Bacteroidia bacterium]
LSKKGELIIKPIKWKTPKAGKNRMSGSSCTTTLPADDYRLFRLFKITTAPCDTCHEDLLKNKKLVNLDSSMQVERELMNAIEIKPSLFSFRSIKIRAPRTLVNLEDDYFIGCESNHLLKWKKKRKKYYYSRLPIKFNVMENITRKHEFCKFYPEPKDCAEPIIRFMPIGKARPLLATAEVGFHYDLDGLTFPGEFFPYVGINLIKEQPICRYNVLLAIDKNTGFNGAIGWQLPFIAFPFNNGNPFSRWQKSGANTAGEKYLRVYLGTALRLVTTRGRYNTIDQDLHLGVSLANFRDNAFIRYIYLQCGVMYDYIDHRTWNFNPIAQVGINLKIAPLSSESD